MFVVRSKPGEELWEAQLSVKHDGFTHWSPPTVLEISCPIDVTNFPVDEQTCELMVSVTWQIYKYVHGSHCLWNFFKKIILKQVTNSKIIVGFRIKQI